MQSNTYLVSTHVQCGKWHDVCLNFVGREIKGEIVAHLILGSKTAWSTCKHGSSHPQRHQANPFMTRCREAACNAQGTLQALHFCTVLGAVVLQQGSSQGSSQIETCCGRDVSQLSCLAVESKRPTDRPKYRRMVKWNSLNPCVPAGDPDCCMLEPCWRQMQTLYVNRAEPWVETSQLRSSSSH
jgi:hypothetical protein